MKNFFSGMILMIFATHSFAQTSPAFNDTSFLQPVEINAVRAGEKTPIAKTNLTKQQIEKNNIGQDLPFILNQTPSVVANSDAGNGIGYTGLRIRGTDATRINITLNGIPFNDAESQGSFLVNVPDISSSAGSIQIQRGVGTSTNGVGSFGGSVNLSTNELNTKKSLELNSTAGSFHSFKNTLKLSSGLIGKHFTFDGRMSQIQSDGYIDRATTRLRSFYTSSAYLSEKNSLRLNIFTGKERTYQAWNGVDEATLKTNRKFNSAGTEAPGQPYYNETDNYQQTHYQLFYNQLSDRWKGNVAAFLTRGKGYYEQYKADESLESYGLPDYNDNGTIISETDLIRQLHLDNYFYGSIFSAQYNSPKRQLIIGGGITQYEGEHFGKVIKAEVQQAVPVNHKWYDNDARKNDYSFYTKWTEQVGKQWQTFIDLQVRHVNYSINGFRDNPGLAVDENYSFFNPKAGLTYSWKKMQAYVSYGRASKEPNRDDFETSTTELAKPEKLDDYEAGLEYKTAKANWGINLYFMNYKDQLVLTGEINDVGAYTRTNIDKSYRAGIEFQGGGVISKWLSASANLTLSRNKVKDFTEFIDDYDNGGQQTKFYEQPDIAFSPSVTGAWNLNIIPFKKAEINLMGKYVSRQYLDNTQQKSRSLDGFYTQDVRAAFAWQKYTTFFLQVNNIFSKKYEPNGYTFSYIYGGQLTTENYYFPMAPINWVIGLNIKL
ncbi:MAG: TonB-dependent receptor [Chitinophagaceae bacterium]|nr:MAG: TonB-dependent receptor [Chitinophagaceae bacterium]